MLRDRAEWFSLEVVSRTSSVLPPMWPVGDGVVVALAGAVERAAPLIVIAGVSEQSLI